MKLKVNDIVTVRVADANVEQGQRRFHAQVVAEPYNGQVLINRIPGDRLTQESVPLADISRDGSKNCWVHYAEVERVGYGLWGFPFDMLRYDSCIPVNFTLASDGPDIILTHGKLPIVARVTVNAHAQFTDGRWKSFCSKVRVVRSVQIKNGIVNHIWEAA